MILPGSGALFARIAIVSPYLEHLDKPLVGKALGGRNFDAPDGKQSVQLKPDALLARRAIGGLTAAAAQISRGQIAVHQVVQEGFRLPTIGIVRAYAAAPLPNQRRQIDGRIEALRLNRMRRDLQEVYPTEPLFIYIRPR